MARRPIIQPAVLTDGNLARENEASTAFAFPWPWASDRGLQYVQREEIKRAQGVNLMPAQWRPGQSILGQVKRLPVPVQLYRRSAKAAHLYRVYQNNCLIDDGSREMRSSVAYITYAEEPRHAYAAAPAASKDLQRGMFVLHHRKTGIFA